MPICCELDEAFTLLDVAAAILEDHAAARGMSMTELDTLARKMSALETAMMRGVKRDRTGTAPPPSAHVASIGQPRARG